MAHVERPARRLRRKTPAGHVALPVADGDAGGGPAPAQNVRRRIRRKTPVGRVEVQGNAGEGPEAAPPPAAPVGANSWATSFLEQESLDPENSGKRKSVYLVTLPHPRNLLQDGGEARARAPGSCSRAQILNIFRDVFEHPHALTPGLAGRRRTGAVLERMVVFREYHSPDAEGRKEVHYHVALLAANTFRFQAYKRALRDRHNLVSHWSCSHEGYWSAVRYGFFPTPKKPQAALDSEPLTYARGGAHPRLFDVAQEPVTAEASRQRRESRVLAASAGGKREPRARERDLYPIIVAQKIRNGPGAPLAAEQLISWLRAHASPALMDLAWSLRGKLSALIDDVWRWEEVDATIAERRKTRWEKVHDAAGSACACGGEWAQQAQQVLLVNEIHPPFFWSDIATSLRAGRVEGSPVVTLMGRHGAEGKSFLLAPLRSIFGVDNVQSTPQPGNFPLLGLEAKRLCILDEWAFDESVLPIATQLLWFEGKPFMISRPQNNVNYTGHLLYTGDAPLFVTCKETDVAPILLRAQEAMERGVASRDTMILRRLRLYGFTQRMRVRDGADLGACGVCFARAVVAHAGAQAAGEMGR